MSGISSGQKNAFVQAIKRRQRHIWPWAKRYGIEAFRLYDADQGDIPIELDVYGNYLHLCEIERPDSGSAIYGAEWRTIMSDLAARTLGVPSERTVTKLRPRRRGGEATSEQALPSESITIWINEAALRFKVNLTDYLDTGLFLHHRVTRGMVADLAMNRNVLNLFSYTGAFSVYAAAGGAASTTSVDLSGTYLRWARENMEENGAIGGMHRYVQSDVLTFLQEQKQTNTRYDLIVCDPPTFSNSRSMNGVFDNKRDHPGLIRDCLSLLSARGQLLFSSNASGFRLAFNDPGAPRPIDLTNETTPEDFARSRPHRAWLFDMSSTPARVKREQPDGNASYRPDKSTGRPQARKRRSNRR
ncbi:MAG: class I SAM-dependent methyltransferase [Spirochaetaceae bacterium]